MARSHRLDHWLAAFLGTTLLGGCAQVLGLGDFTDGEGQGGGGMGGASTTTTTATTRTSTTGQGGDTQSGGGGAGGETTLCEPGEVVDCDYSGPARTEGVGDCKAGTKACLEDGSGFGECAGEVLPADEDCASIGDEDCDGQPNDGCACDPGTVADCYGGAAGTEGVGACHKGTQACKDDGTGYEACEGEVVPSDEDCDAALVDEDCDGQVNESGAACVCVPSSTASCYSGPAGTDGVGLCTAGTKKCAPDGLSYGACSGEVLPAAETCAAAADEDCDGGDCALWGKHFDGAIIVALVGDSLGSSYLLGEFQSVVNLGGGNLATSGGYDLFLAKLDVMGNHLWSKRFGDASDQRAVAMTLDATGGVIVAANVKGTVNFGGANLSSAGNYDVAVARFDTAGNHVWSRIFGDASAQTVSAISADPLGNLVVAGSFLGTLDFGNATGSITAVAGGQTDIFLASLAVADGKAQWRKQFGDAAAQNVNSIATDGNGSIALVGRYGGTTAFGPFTLTANGAADMFVAKLDSAGTPACVKNVVAGDSDFFTTVHFDSASAMVLSGSFYAPITFGGSVLTTDPSGFYGDVFLVKLTVACGHVWSRSFGFVSKSEYASGSVVLPDDAIALALNAGGAFDMGGGVMVSAGGDVAIGVFDAAGVHRWSRMLGDATAQDFPHVGVRGGHVLVSVQTAGAIDFGAGPVAASANGETVAVIGP